MANRREIEAVDEILARTKKGEIRWSVPWDRALPTPPNEGRPVQTFFAEVGGKRLRLCSYRYKHYTDEDTFAWLDEVMLELGDQTDNAWWPFPETNSRWELLREVQHSVVGVDDWLKKFTGGSDDE